MSLAESICNVVIQFHFRKALLRLWLQRNGHQATYSQLVRVMHRAKMIDTIDALLQVLRDTPLAQQPPQPQQQGFI